MKQNCFEEQGIDVDVTRLRVLVWLQPWREGLTYRLSQNKANEAESIVMWSWGAAPPNIGIEPCTGQPMKWNALCNSMWYVEGVEEFQRWSPVIITWLITMLYHASVTKFCHLKDIHLLAFQAGSTMCSLLLSWRWHGSFWRPRTCIGKSVNIDSTSRAVRSGDSGDSYVLHEVARSKIDVWKDCRSEVAV